MSKGITNFQIETALKNINDEDLNYNFTGVFLASKVNSLYRKKGQISFIIANTDSSGKGGMHW